MNLTTVNNVIASIPKGKRFQFTDYFNTTPVDNRKNGKWFKEHVLKGLILNVKHISLTTDRHDYYEKI